MHGNQATIGKADMNPSEAGSMVKEEKSHKREILSLIGLLLNATKVVKPGSGDGPLSGPIQALWPRS